MHSHVRSNADYPEKTNRPDLHSVDQLLDLDRCSSWFTPFPEFANQKDMTTEKSESPESGFRLLVLAKIQALEILLVRACAEIPSFDPRSLKIEVSEFALFDAEDPLQQAIMEQLIERLDAIISRRSY